MVLVLFLLTAASLGLFSYFMVTPSIPVIAAGLALCLVLLLGVATLVALHDALHPEQKQKRS